MDTAQMIATHKYRDSWLHNTWGAILRWLRLTNDITVKVYHGYGLPGRYVVYGHVLSLGPLPRKRFSGSFLKNTAALLRLFMVKPCVGAHLQLRWEGQLFKTVSEDDGFFKIEWEVNEHLPPGWHPIQVEMTDAEENILTTGTGYMLVPYATQLGFISDIDDTFLISHSSNLRKRLYVLFTRNAHSRKPFDGVVRHYQALTLANTTESAPNPFFYVSSSEWNLFDYILAFTTVNGLPRGVFLLSQLKRFSQIFKTGQNKHATKFMRIVRILEHYPSQRFVLLGDSSQQDPNIYAAVVKHFPNQVHAVYIRDVYHKNKQKTAATLEAIEAEGVPCCFFEHSSEALEHSKKIGLIK
jgi:phosphatidate phosphatase APP1